MPRPVQLFQDFADLFELLQKKQQHKVLVLTPNKRLSRFLSDGYNRHQAAFGGGRAWPSLACFSIQGWLQQAWQQLALAPTHPGLERMPLSSIQERILWQRLVSQHEETPALLSGKATGNQAMEAWRLLKQWQLELPPAQDGNGRIFQAWCEAFSQLCEAQDLLSSAEVANVVTECIQQGQLALPGEVWLYGFDEVSPQIENLLDAMTARGTQVEDVSWGLQPQQVQRHEFTAEESEIEAAALWAQSLLQSALQNNQNTPPRIAIVIPKLAQLREKVERIFSRVFEPQYIFPQQQQHASGFNISAGQPMDSVPVVVAALNVLNCQRGLLDLESVSHLLRSPFIGHSSELAERAILDAELRKGDLKISLAQLQQAAGQRLGEAGEEYWRRCPNLFESLEAFDRIRAAAPRQQLPSQWGQLFLQQLQAFGWPGQRTLDTLEFQQVQSWQDALQEFAALDAVCGELDWSSALQMLTVMLKHNSFQAQTKTSPIQILGILEAAGLPFDHLWLMNMDDETWPPAPNPNPLLPIHFQIEHGMPQSSSERELAYARRLLQRLASSAPYITYSHSCLQDDKHMRVSPLLADVPLQPFQLDAAESFAAQLFRQREIEASLDNCGPKVVDTNTIRGGTGILKDQAACPFQAFARHRLQAEDIPTPTMGLDAIERGNLVHRVMELIWRRLRRHSRLLQLSGEDLDDLIQRSIEESVQRFESRHSVGKRFLQIESKRLAAQARAWLELEKQRQPFNVVFNEGRKTVKLGKLPLNIRYDRVDRLEDGSLFVLDYKTGKQDVRSWTGQRPDEPQVPLYCVANSSKVSGAAFGQIAADEIALKGIADDESIAPGLRTPDMLFKLDLPDDWQQVIAHWRSVLERLAQEFMAGAAAVDPKIPGVTCRYCELKSLCRIKEQFNLDDEEYHQDYGQDGSQEDDGEDAQSEQALLGLVF